MSLESLSKTPDLLTYGRRAYGGSNPINSSMVVERPVAQPSPSSRGLFLDVRFSSSSVGFKSLHPAKAMIMSRLAAALNTVRQRPYWGSPRAMMPYNAPDIPYVPASPFHRAEATFRCFLIFRSFSLIPLLFETLAVWSKRPQTSTLRIRKVAKKWLSSFGCELVLFA